jgi:hypothetical protein
MKAEIELSIDTKGNPVISVKHMDRDSSLEQKLLGILIKNALSIGLKIVHDMGYLISNGDSWERYKIKAIETKI